MSESLSPNIERLTRQYIDGTRFTSSDDVLIFAMNLFHEFEDRYHHQLGSSLQAAFKSIDDGDAIALNGKKEIDIFFEDMMEATEDQARSQQS